MCIRDKLTIQLMNRAHDHVPGMGPVINCHHFMVVADPMQRGEWPHQETWLEQQGLTPPSIVDQWRQGIREYIAGVHGKNADAMLKRYMEARNVFTSVANSEHND